VLVWERRWLGRGRIYYRTCYLLDLLYRIPDSLVQVCLHIDYRTEHRQDSQTGTLGISCLYCFEGYNLTTARNILDG
jgi:hypothetical protein